MLPRNDRMHRSAAGALYLPMSRSDIAGYLGLIIEAVSRGFRLLNEQGLLAFDNRKHLRILDRAAIQALAGGAREAQRA